MFYHGLFQDLGLIVGAILGMAILYGLVLMLKDKIR